MTKPKKHYALLRQWKMLNLLPSRHPVDAATLRGKLEDEGFSVDLRTVQRDLKELTEVFPITAKQGRPISWRWDRHAESFNLPGMDRTAALTLKMVNGFMANLLPKNCLKSLSPYLRRADAVLDQSNEKKFGDWPDKVRVIPRTQPLLPPDIDEEILDVIYDSLFKDRRFKATYHKKGANTPVEYVVNPLGLIASDPILYLVAVLWDYDDIMLLPVHRFRSAEMTYEASQKPRGFNLDHYLESGALGFPMAGEKTISIRVIFDAAEAAHLHESPLSPNQTITSQVDGRKLIEAEVLDTHQLRWWLLGFGQHVEVVEPESLRMEFTDKIQEMANLYNH